MLFGIALGQNGSTRESDTDRGCYRMRKIIAIAYLARDRREQRPPGQLWNPPRWMVLCQRGSRCIAHDERSNSRLHYRTSAIETFRSIARFERSLFLLRYQ